MISKEIQRILAGTTLTRDLDHILKLANPAREIAKLMQNTGHSESMRALASSTRIHGEMKALIASVQISDATRGILDAMKPSADLRAALDALQPSAEVQRTLSSMQPTHEMRNFVRWANSPLSPGISDLLREATEAQRVVETSHRTINDISRMMDSLRLDLRLIGETDLGEAAEDKGDDPALVLPAEAAARIARVEFLPIRLMNALRANPDEMRQLSDREFEEFTAELLRQVGFDNVLLTPRSGDGGRDVVAARQVNGIPLLFAFECKRYAENNKIGPALLRGLLGTVTHGATKANIGVLVTTSTFTRASREFIVSEALIDGKDFHDIVEWLHKYRP